MSFTVLIPARLSSTRLPKKVLADIHGKPMVVRVAEQALKTSAKRVLVACDSEQIQTACSAYQIDSILTAKHHTSGTTRLAEVAQKLDLSDDEIVVNVQADEPMIPIAIIEQVAQELMSSTLPMATAAHFIHDFAEFTNPNCVKVVLDKNKQALYFSRAMIAYPRDHMLNHEPILPHPLPLRHIGIYAYRVGFLKQYATMSASPLEELESLEQLRVLWHGHKIAVAFVDQSPPAGVDTQADLDRVRHIWHNSF